MTKNERRELTVLRKENTTQKIRLALAEKWVAFLNMAYDAFKTHGVDYQKSELYKDTSHLDEALELPLQEGRNKIIHWLDRLASDVSAMVRRKSIRPVN